MVNSEMDVQRVGLGFAEFVGQLLRETFDAVLDAQNHQIQRIAELEQQLSLDTLEFAQRFLSAEDIAAETVALYGSNLQERMKPTPQMERVLVELLGSADVKTALFRGTLSRAGFEALKQYVLESLVEVAKERLRLVLQQVSAMRIVVDSGEVKAKLELSCWQNTESLALPMPKVLDPKDVKMQGSIGAQATRLTSLKELKMAGQSLATWVDQDGSKSVVVESATGGVLAKPAIPLPGVRLMATPAKGSSQAHLMSEVTLKFKTV
jgi:hypothetical protein